MTRRIARRLLCFLSTGILMLGLSSPSWSLNAGYNRPLPLMDYAPQETGVYDGAYAHLSEAGCRACHGDSTSDRHHYTSIVLKDHLCFPCHEFVPQPPGVVVTRDCLTGGCHSGEDISLNGWHHDTDLGTPDNCVACHNPNGVSPITAFMSFAEYPPSVVTPSPFSCENCHWNQDVAAAADGFDPDTSPQADAGHPSTYDHHDVWGQPRGYHEYKRPILALSDTHHLAVNGDGASGCDRCHGGDPNDPGWDPFNPELIRYCETCHDLNTLHLIPAHGGGPDPGDGVAAMGWEATGFHVNGSSELEPAFYRSFTRNEVCFSCHSGGPPTPYFYTLEHSPAIQIEAGGIFPNSASAAGLVAITGEHFGEAYGAGRALQLKKRSAGAAWIELPDFVVRAWTDMDITFQIPYATLTPGNYEVRVRNQDGGYDFSNQVGLTYLDSGPAPLWPASGPCGTWIEFRYGSFGNAQEEMLDSYEGVYRVVDFASSSGVYTALAYRNWSSTRFEVRFLDFFEDGIDPSTGERNFVRDRRGGLSRAEPRLKNCEQQQPGAYTAYVKTIRFGDEDASGGLSPGDVILEVSSSDPFLFGLTHEPYIKKLKPQLILLGEEIQIVGFNFGSDQDGAEVRVGKKSHYGGDSGQGRLLDLVTAWGDTKIVVKLTGPEKWAGQVRYVWIERDGMKSNCRKVEITTP